MFIWHVFCSDADYLIAFGQWHGSLLTSEGKWYWLELNALSWWFKLVSKYLVHIFVSKFFPLQLKRQSHLKFNLRFWVIISIPLSIEYKNLFRINSRLQKVHKINYSRFGVKVHSLMLGMDSYVRAKYVFITMRPPFGFI